MGPLLTNCKEKEKQMSPSNNSRRSQWCPYWSAKEEQDCLRTWSLYKASKCLWGIH